MADATCPRCSSKLAPGYGLLGEDACASCNGRVLSAGLTQRVLLDEGGLDPALIQEIARESAGQRLACAVCSEPMAPVTLKGTAVDICFPCGVTFLDAGELERLSGGRHQEHSPPPTGVRPVDERPLVAEPEADPRATWEKALPLYVLEAWVVWAVLVGRGIVSPSLTAVGVALGIVMVPLGFSMLVEVDLRSLIARQYGFSHRYRGGGIGGILLFALAVAVGGIISTLNAALAEQFPRVFSTRNAVVALVLLLVAGLLW